MHKKIQNYGLLSAHWSLGLGQNRQKGGNSSTIYDNNEKYKIVDYNVNSKEEDNNTELTRHQYIQRLEELVLGGDMNEDERDEFLNIIRILFERDAITFEQCFQLKNKYLG